MLKKNTLELLIDSRARRPSILLLLGLRGIFCVIFFVGVLFGPHYRAHANPARSKSSTTPVRVPVVSSYAQQLLQRIKPMDLALFPANIFRYLTNNKAINYLENHLADTTPFQTPGATRSNSTDTSESGKPVIADEFYAFEYDLIRKINLFSQSTHAHDLQYLAKLIDIYCTTTTSGLVRPTLAARDAIQVLHRMNQSLRENRIANRYLTIQHLDAMMQIATVSLSANQFTYFGLDLHKPRNFAPDKRRLLWKHSFEASKMIKMSDAYIHPERLALTDVRAAVGKLRNQTVLNGALIDSSTQNPKTEQIHDTLWRAMTNPYELISKY